MFSKIVFQARCKNFTNLTNLFRFEINPPMGGDALKEVEIEFDGNLEDFLAFIEQYCHKPVIVWRYQFDEDSFRTEIKEDTGNNNESDFIDARTLDPKLCRFEQYLKRDVGCRLLEWLKDTNTTIGFREIELWYNELLEEMEALEKSCLAERNEKIARERDAKVKAEQDLMEKLNALADDPAFRACKTQRAMYAYATEKIEGLSELREAKVKQAIALLADKVGLKKH